MVLIQRAIEALEKFYKDNAAALSLQQTKAVAHRRSLSAAPGEAPAPPPSTWDAGYGGESDEHDGVVGILTMIKKDVQKDISTAEKAEKESIDAHNEFSNETDNKINGEGGLEEGIANFLGAVSRA